jgi:hypothetical protein
MAKNMKHVVCLHCNLGHTRELKQTFLGFFKFTCHDCKKESTYPLSTGYVIIYGIALALFAIGLASGRMQAVVLGVAGCIALTSNHTIRGKVKEAKAKEREPRKVAEASD